MSDENPLSSAVAASGIISEYADDMRVFSLRCGEAMAHDLTYAASVVPLSLRGTAYAASSVPGADAQSKQWKSPYSPLASSNWPIVKRVNGQIVQVFVRRGGKLVKVWDKKLVGTSTTEAADRLYTAERIVAAELSPSLAPVTAEQINAWEAAAQASGGKLRYEWMDIVPAGVSTMDPEVTRLPWDNGRSVEEGIEATAGTGRAEDEMASMMLSNQAGPTTFYRIEEGKVYQSVAPIVPPIRSEPLVDNPVVMRNGVKP
jgi:hypothetical protein